MSAPVEELDLGLGDRTLRVRRLETRDRDTASAPATLVFLHEGFGSIETWREFPARLCAFAGLPGVVYDRTGYGRSTGWPADPGLDYMTVEADEVLPRLLAGLHLDSVILIGHSDGGTIALNYAARNPANLVAVVTIGAHVVNEPITVASIEVARRQYVDGDLRDKLARYHGVNVDGAFWLCSGSWLAPGFEPMDAAVRLPRVRVPVLAVQGERDEYGTRRQLDLIAAGVSGRCETEVLPGCGHWPHRDCPNALLERVSAFLASVTGTPVAGALQQDPAS